MVKVSVIIPVYNVEAYLRQCLDSVVNQTLRDIEIICVDDGSTDGSAAILAEYAAKDARVKVISRVRSNAGAARNAGMAVATGEYLGFVDSDDWCELTLFEKAYAKAKADNADVAEWRFHQYDERTKKTGAPRVFPEGVVKTKAPFTAEVLGNGVFAPITYAPWGRLVRRAFVAQEEIAFQEIVRTNDVYFCCLLRALAPRQTIVDEVLYTYRIGTGTNLQANNGASPESVVQAWERVASELERRQLFEEFRGRLVSASANSFFYTLNSMSDTSAYVAFFELLRRVYEENPLFSGVQLSDIVSCQTAAFLRLFMERKSPLDFLVGQENYYRERLAIEYWAKLAAQKSLAAETLAKQTALQDVKAAHLAEEESRSRNIDLTAIVARLKGAVAQKQHDIETLKDSLAVTTREKEKLEHSASYRLGCALTWLPRKAMIKWHSAAWKRKNESR